MMSLGATILTCIGGPLPAIRRYNGGNHGKQAFNATLLGKVKKNATCPCGSGHKAKKCCLKGPDHE